MYTRRKITPTPKITAAKWHDGKEVISFVVPWWHNKHIAVLLETQDIQALLNLFCFLLGREWDQPRAKIVSVGRAPENATEVTLEFGPHWYETKDALEGYREFCSIPDPN